MRTPGEVERDAEKYAKNFIERTERERGMKFQNDLRCAIIGAIQTGYQQGVIDERDNLHKERL